MKIFLNTKKTSKVLLKMFVIVAKDYISHTKFLNASKSHIENFFSILNIEKFNRSCAHL